jgi:hypothetical protein
VSIGAFVDSAAKFERAALLHSANASRHAIARWHRRWTDMVMRCGVGCVVFTLTRLCVVKQAQHDIARKFAQMRCLLACLTRRRRGGSMRCAHFAIRFTMPFDISRHWCGHVICLVLCAIAPTCCRACAHVDICQWHAIASTAAAHVDGVPKHTHLRIRLKYYTTLADEVCVCVWCCLRTRTRSVFDGMIVHGSHDECVGGVASHS